jgi:thiamine kinase-like enzyme
VIHGEFYGKNLLLRRRQIRVVDWESSAVAAGEIDLAALTEGRWPARTVRRCEQAYRRARWPCGVPAGFGARLAAAKIYLNFRWLGERPEWALREKWRWRYDHLHRAATHLHLL